MLLSIHMKISMCTDESATARFRSPSLQIINPASWVCVATHGLSGQHPRTPFDHKFSICELRTCGAFFVGSLKLTMPFFAFIVSAILQKLRSRKIRFCVKRSLRNAVLSKRKSVKNHNGFSLFFLRRGPTTPSLPKASWDGVWPSTPSLLLLYTDG